MAKHITQTHSWFAGQLTKLVMLDVSCDNPTHSQDRVTKITEATNYVNDNKVHFLVFSLNRHFFNRTIHILLVPISIINLHVKEI